MTAPLDARTAVVTGAGRGIGRAVAAELACAGGPVDRALAERFRGFYAAGSLISPEESARVLMSRLLRTETGLGRAGPALTASTHIPFPLPFSTV